MQQVQYFTDYLIALGHHIGLKNLVFIFSSARLWSGCACYDHLFLAPLLAKICCRFERLQFSAISPSKFSVCNEKMFCFSQNICYLRTKYFSAALPRSNEAVSHRPRIHLPPCRHLPAPAPAPDPPTTQFVPWTRSVQLVHLLQRLPLNSEL